MRRRVVITILCVRLPRGVILKRLWFVAVLVYTFFRAGAVGFFLSDFGVSPWIYLAVDLASSVPFAITSTRLVEKLVSDRPGWKSSAIWVAVSYLAPDLYLLVALQQAPSRVYLITLAVILILAFISGFTLVRRARRSI